MAVSFEVSADTQPRTYHSINQAFTATELQLAEQSCPGDKLARKYNHLKGVPLHTFTKVQPMLLIGSDHPHLLTSIHSVLTGPIGAPVAVCTRLGWAVQGPTSFLQHPPGESSFLHLSVDTPCSNLHKDVQRLWQLDILPYKSEREVTRSKQDQTALTMLDEKSTTVIVEGVLRYATPLLRKRKVALPCASPVTVMPLLRSTERRLSTNPEFSKVYNQEIHKLVEAGYAERITSEEASCSAEYWYIPHHLVHHNRKARVLFNCSFLYQESALNDDLLPGPSLGPSLFGVLLRFREHADLSAETYGLCSIRSDAFLRTAHSSASFGATWRETGHLISMSGVSCHLAQFAVRAAPYTLCSVTFVITRVATKIYWRR